MITDNQTNFLFLADTLPKKYLNFYQRFLKVLDNCKIAVELLPQTKDIWAVDYMPIQVEVDKFVRFSYRPSYLMRYKKWIKTISDVDSICNDLGIQTVKTDIVVDGGNVTRTTNKVIMTDRVFVDNPSYDRKQLIRKLYELLEIDKLYF